MLLHEDLSVLTWLESHLSHGSPPRPGGPGRRPGAGCVALSIRCAGFEPFAHVSISEQQVSSNLVGPRATPVLAPGVHCGLA